MLKREGSEQEDKEKKATESKRRSSGSEKCFTSSEKISHMSGVSGERREDKSEEGYSGLDGANGALVNVLYQPGTVYRNNNLCRGELSMDDDTSAISQTSSTSGKFYDHISKRMFIGCCFFYFTVHYFTLSP